MPTRLLLTAAILSWSGEAFAYRPFDGTDADVAETGEFELELGPVGFYRLGTQNNLTLADAVLNYGLVHRLELVAQFEYVIPLGSSNVPPDQALDSALLAKVVLREGCLQASTGLSVATEDGLLFPPIGGAGNVGASGSLIVSQCFGRSVILHYNGDVELTPDHNLDLFASVIGEGPRAWLVRPVAEIYAEREFNAYTTYSALVGAIWRAVAKLDVDAGFRAAALSGTLLLEARLGITWTFL
ncbi:MAG TPA: hypothetical protein VMB50_06685 [Myxococcales bacterium]|nr:hypothetical protein [Myxococcales bacterium]